MTNFKNFIESFYSWGENTQTIESILLVGSYTRNKARKDSDIDLIVIVDNQKKLLSNLDWIYQFGKVKKYLIENWGLVQSVRVFYEKSFEVEFGITEKKWIKKPLDPGTFKVINDGLKIIIDKTNKVSKLINKIENQNV